MPRHRQYWVVSPNVRYDYHTVSAWRNSCVEWKAAFMGWGLDHRLGRKFAYEVKPGDVILVARSRAKRPETVGFGIVVGDFKSRLRGFVPPDSFQLLRQLEPFVPMSRPSKNLPWIEAVNQTSAIHKLHPEEREAHKRLCEWMDERLSVTADRDDIERKGRPHLTFGPLQNDKQLEYQIRTPVSVRQARKREAELVERYRRWLEIQGRELQTFRSDGIKCDAYEQARQNLIEAKCATGRQYIRMAAGQLLDYEYSAKNALGKCHKAILLPSKPEESLLDWLKTISINVVWEKRSAFLDNADGQFM